MINGKQTFFKLQKIIKQGHYHPLKKVKMQSHTTHNNVSSFYFISLLFFICLVRPFFGIHYTTLPYTQHTYVSNCGHGWGCWMIEMGTIVTIGKVILYISCTVYSKGWTQIKCDGEIKISFWFLFDIFLWAWILAFVDPYIMRLSPLSLDQSWSKLWSMQ